MGYATNYALCDVVMQYAGSRDVFAPAYGVSTSLQDKVFSDGNLAAPLVEKVYVSRYSMIQDSRTI